MSTLEIISIIATFLGVASFSFVFTILYQSYVHSSVSHIEAGKRDIELIDMALNERSTRTRRRRKAGAIIRTVLFALFLCIVIPLFLFSLINRFAGDKPVFGKTFMVVASGSMSYANSSNRYLAENELSDQIDRFDIILLDAVESPADLKKYDIIAYKNENGVNIIHRIVSISEAGENVYYTTRGDANYADDANPVEFANVLGVYRGERVPLIGIIVMFLQSYSGIITVIALLYCLFMIDFVSRKIEICENSRLAELLSAIESDENNAKAMRAEFKETIYYRGFAYHFDETGFVEKTELEGELPEEDVMIKEYDDGSPSRKITIETRKNNENGKAE